MMHNPGKQNLYLLAASQVYNKRHGLRPIAEGVFVAIDEQTARATADAYEALPSCDLHRPHVAQAFLHFAVEVHEQFSFITNTLGITVEPWPHAGQPYDTSVRMIADVTDNLHLFVFTGGEPHLLLDGKTTGTLSLNTQFRAVHDIFGHVAEGYSFSARGEENAWLKHSQMFSYWAQKALTTETRGQSCWFHFGKHWYDQHGNRRSFFSEKPYPTQKIALLPDEFTDWQHVLAEATCASVSA